MHIFSEKVNLVIGHAIISTRIVWIFISQFKKKDSDYIQIFLVPKFFYLKPPQCFNVVGILQNIDFIFFNYSYYLFHLTRP